MTYYLGIDLGTTYAAAATYRDGRVEIVTLGDRAAVVPSVLFFRDDGEILIGDAASRRGMNEPTRVVREFKRRVGDPTPVMVGSTPYSADALTARLLEEIVAASSEREGGAPAGIGITHPANWGPYKTDVLDQAVRMAEVGAAVTVTEPEAAAIHYAHAERLEVGQIVAVYDLGGGTFDAAVLRKTKGGFEILGEAEGIERLGGIDFDEAVFQHVLRWAGPALADLDPDEPATLQAVSRLRQECVAAKEALSSDTDATVPVLLPNLQTEVRITRAEFEAMIRPSLAETIGALRQALRNAGIGPDAVSAVLLVGGSSRIPLVAQMVSAEFGRPVALDVHPKHTVAMGAAIAAAPDVAADRLDPSAAAHVPTSVETTNEAPVAEPVAVTAGEGAGPARTPVTDPFGRGAAAVSTAIAMRPALDTQAESAHSMPPPPARRATPTRPRWLAPVAALVVALGGLAAAFAMKSTGDGTAVAPTTAATVVARESATVAGGADLAGTTTNQSDPALAGSDEPAPPDTTTTVTEPAVAVTATSVPATSASPTTAVEATTTTTAAPAGLDVTIDSISVEEDRYVVNYSTNFEPLISSEPSATHIHFFFDTVDVAQAGVPGSGPWILYDTPAPFTEYGVADRPEGASQMCATAATNGHAVVDSSRFHCMDLPPAP